MRHFIKRTLGLNEEVVSGLFVEKDEDGYWSVCNKKGDELIFVSSLKRRNQLVNELKASQEWNRIPEPSSASLAILKKYKENKVFNGAAYDTLDDKGMISYKMDEKGNVKGWLVAPGVAIHQHKGSWQLDHLPSGVVITTMRSKAEIEELVEFTKDVVVWSDRNVPYAIGENPNLKEYFTSLKEAIQSGTEKPPVDIRLKMNMDFYTMDVSEDRKVAFEQAMDELYSMEGNEIIKKEVQAFLESLRGERKLLEVGGIEISKSRKHMLFVGPPGTGKTVMARILARLLYSLGFIKRNHLVEVTREELVDNHIGGTETKTAAVVKRAMDGLLFVDETYTLLGSDDGKDFGRDALQIIMTAMENNPERLLVVFAGYESDIDDLLKVNEGLPSRFPYRFHFRDYTPRQLTRIAIQMMESKGYECIDIEDALTRVLEGMAVKGVVSGNARMCRTISDRILQEQKVRIGKIVGLDGVRCITKEDVLKATTEKDNDFDEEGLSLILERGYKEMDRLIGMSDLKQSIRSFVNYVSVQKRRHEAGSKGGRPPRKHMTFEGPPGTGKTTFAHLMGTLMKGMGLLSSGHFVEAKRNDLVGNYQGHTAKAVNKILNKAKGGVLFIDEAYGLVTGENDTFGKEAVTALIDGMESLGEDMVVILAGYSHDIQKLLDSNAGFESRISERFIFPHYSPEELAQLARLELDLADLTLDVHASKRMDELILNHASKKGYIDGDGRWVRNFCEKVVSQQANRVMEKNLDDLFTIEVVDIDKGFTEMLKRPTS